MKQAVIYTRFSPRPKSGDCNSCDYQEQKGLEYCTYREWDVLDVFHDKAASGKSTNGRPGLEQALNLVCKHRATLVCYNMSRLSRSINDLVRIVAMLDKQGADVVLMTEQLDTTTPTGRLTFHVIAAIGQFNREVTSEHTREVLRTMQKNGLRVSRAAPFGKRLDPGNPKKLLIDHDEQDTIAIILRLRRQKLPLRVICERLTNMDRKARGPIWYKSTVNSIIHRHQA